jgi:CBS domain-containing protein
MQRGISCLPVVEEDALVGIVTEFDLMQAFVRTCAEGRLSGDIDPPIEQLMTGKVMGVEVTDRLVDAEAALAALGVHHAPVLSDGVLVGFLSDRDLRRAKGRGMAPESAVDGIMTKNAKTLRPSDQLSTAARAMIEFKFSALPIVDLKLVGILSSRDVLDHCMNTLRAE